MSSIIAAGLIATFTMFLVCRRIDQRIRRRRQIAFLTGPLRQQIDEFQAKPMLRPELTSVVVMPAKAAETRSHQGWPYAGI